MRKQSLTFLIRVSLFVLTTLAGIGIVDNHNRPVEDRNPNLTEGNPLEKHFGTNAGVVYYVDSAATGANDGTSWKNAYRFLQDALSVAEFDDSILISKGTYYPDEADFASVANNDPGESFNVSATLSILGGFDASGGDTTLSLRDWKTNLTILNGDINQNGTQNGNSYNIVVVQNTFLEPLIDGLIIENGFADGSGPPAQKGAGLRANDAKIRIRNTTFRNNRAVNGSPVNPGGGAIFINNGTDLVLENCLFYQNRANLGGGAISLGTNCQLLAINTVLRGNLSSGTTRGAGALFGDDENIVHLVNTTISGNRGPQRGAIYLDEESSLTIDNSIIWNNGDAPTIGLRNSDPYVVTSSIIEGSGGSNNWLLTDAIDGGGNMATYPQFVVDADPITVPNSEGNLRLQVNSPAIDSGDDILYTAVAGPVEDLDNVARIQVGRIDMGAYEFDCTSPVTTFYVDSAATGANTGFSWRDAFVSLQDALTNPCGYDSVLVSKGTYYPDEFNGGTDNTNNRSNSFVIPPNVTVLGGFNTTTGDTTLNSRDWKNNPTILSGDIDQDQDFSGNTNRVVVVSSGQKVLDGFTITWGNADAGPAGQRRGAGIFCNNGSPTLQNLTVIHNQCELNGAAMFFANGATPMIYNTKIVDNQSEDGGGGVSSQNSELLFANCEFRGNYAPENGGGLFILNSNADLINCTMSGNRSNNSGGAVYQSGGVISLENSIIWNNSASGSTAGIRASFFVSSGTASAINSIVDNSGGSSSWAGGPDFPTDGGNNKDLDPLFATIADPNMAPSDDGNLVIQTASPALDMGDNSLYPTSAPVLDLACDRRIRGPLIDMGAYEVFSCSLVGTTIYVDSSAALGGDGLSWQGAFRDLQDALHFPCPYDSILVSKGHYFPDRGSSSIDSSFVIPSGVVLLGGFDVESGDTTMSTRDWKENVTVLSGDLNQDGNGNGNSRHVLRTTNSDSILLDGFLVERGSAIGGAGPSSNRTGGGLLANNARMRIRNTTFRSNRATGPIAATTASGGAIYANTNSTLLVENSAFIANQSEFGGAVGLANSSSIVTVNCEFRGNLSNMGSAVHGASLSDVHFINSTISGNSGARAVQLDMGSSLRVDNSIVWNNGNTLSFIVSTPSTYLVRNSIIEGSGGSENWSLTGATDGGGNKDIDPYFVTETDPSLAPTDLGDLRLQSNSPAINMGDSSLYPNDAPTFDLDCVARIQQAEINMGAYESTCSSQRTLYVDAAAGLGGDGTNWNAAFRSLQDALIPSCEIDSILVAQGTYYPDEFRGGIIDENRNDRSFQLRSNLVLLGGFPTGGGVRDWKMYPTSLSGDINQVGGLLNNSARVVEFVDVSNTILDGFTIEEGDGEEGAGLGVDSSSVRLQNLTIKRNRAGDNGGGVFISNESDVVIQNCLFERNVCRGGASNGGAAIYIAESDLTIINSVLTGNDANQNTWAAGLLADLGSQVDFINCTLSGNRGYTPVIFARETSFVSLSNTISWNNLNLGGPQRQLDVASNSSAIIRSSMVQNFGGNMIIVDGGNNKTGGPRFVRAAATGGQNIMLGDLRLQASSAAINMGDTTLYADSFPSIDLDCNERIMFQIDMGAYENPCPFLQTVYVDSAAAAGGDGRTWNTAFRSLQDALAITCDIESIYVSKGTYYPDQADDGATNSDNRNMRFNIPDSVSVLGGFNTSLGAITLVTRDWIAHRTVLSGDIDQDGTFANNTSSVVRIGGVSDQTVLDGFTITGGSADDTGFGDSGGGIFLRNDSRIILRNLRVIGNQAIYGGGMFTNLSSPTLYNVQFIDNAAQQIGGGVHCSDCNDDMVNVEFKGNSAGNGGGIVLLNGSTASLINATFSGNRAVVDGGAVYVDNSNGTAVSICNSIIWNNSASNTTNTSSASIFANGPVTISYSDVANSRANDSWSLPGATDGANNKDVDPLFVVAADPSTASNAVGDLRLQSTSSLIDMGIDAAYPNGALTFDIAGGDRIQLTQIDMGAYESALFCIETPILYVDSAATGANTGLTWSDAFTSLQDALTYLCDFDSIFVSEGTYFPDEFGGGQINSDDRQVSFIVPDSVVLIGGFSTAQGDTLLSAHDCIIHPTILSGDINQDLLPSGNSHLVVSVESGSSGVLLRSLIVEGGNANGNSNSLRRGAGIRINNSSIFLDDVTVRNNVATDRAGGVYIINNSVVFIENSHVSGNTANQRGGAFYMSNGNLTMVNTAILGNRAALDGAAVYSTGGSINITNSTLSGNRASSQGALLDISGALTVNNSVLWDNFLGTSGTDSQVYEFVTNTIFSHSLVQHSGGSASWMLANASDGGGNKDEDPQFVEPADPVSAANSSGDLRLQITSPAIDMGESSLYADSFPAIDLACNDRIQLGRIDMGAHESACQVTPLVCQNITVPLDSLGLVVIVPEMLDVNEDAESLTIDPDTLTCADGGLPIPVQLIRDNCDGTSDTCTALVTAIDTILPEMIAPRDTFVYCSDAVDPTLLGMGFTADACGVDTVIHNDTHIDASCTDTIIREWISFDFAGNQSLPDTQIIVILDTIAPQVACLVADTIFCGGPSSLSNTISAMTSTGKLFSGERLLDTLTFPEIDGRIESVSIQLKVRVGDKDHENVRAFIRQLPSSKYVTLFSNLDMSTPCNGDDMDVKFSDGALNSNQDFLDQCLTSSPVKMGEFRPLGPLSTYNRRPITGDWELLFQTSGIAATDSLLSWSIDITYQPQVSDCSETSITFQDDTTCISRSCGATIERTWIAVDACGNRGTCLQTITILDTTELICRDISVPLDTSGLAVLTAEQVLQTQSFDSIFQYTGGLQSLTIPAGVTSVAIEAAGGRGGRGSEASSMGGAGAIVGGQFDVVAGQNLQIIVAGAGEAGALLIQSPGGGGGGATFVARGNTGFTDFVPANIMLIAGGGGGGYFTQDGFASTQLQASADGPGGATGSSGGSNSFNGGGGASAIKNGEGPLAGQAAINGAIGGNRGGYGGGGGATNQGGVLVGGGGGGATGGDAVGGALGNPRPGGAGTSYIGGDNPVFFSAANADNGYVRIIYNYLPTSVRLVPDTLDCNAITRPQDVLVISSRCDGKMDTCHALVTAVDIIDPIVFAPADTVAYCNIGTTTDITGLATSSAVDSCGIVDMSFGDLYIDNACTDTILRIFTARDLDGNVSRPDTQRITVLDTLPPVLICPQDDTILCGRTSQESITFSGTDIGGIAFDDDRPFMLTVPDSIEDQIIGVELSVAFDAPDVDNITLYLESPQGTELMVFNISDTSCSVRDIAATFSDTATASHEDFQNECNSSSPAKGPGFYRPDNSFADFIGEDMIGNWMLFVDNGSSDSIVLTSWSITFSTESLPFVSDACSDVILTFHDDTTSTSGSFGATIERTWVATDGCGNKDSCLQNITMVGLIPSSCPPDTAVTSGVVTDPARFGLPVYELVCCDQASIITFVDDSTGFDGICSNDTLGMINRTFYAQDCFGQVDSSCVQSIAFIDTTPPQLFIPPDVMAECTGLDTSLTGAATAIDDTEVIITFFDEGIFDQCGGSILRVWQAVDACGNASDFMDQTITLIDSTPPEVICPPDIFVPCVSGLELSIPFDTVINKNPLRQFGTQEDLVARDTITIAGSNATVANLLLGIEVNYRFSFNVVATLISPAGTEIQIFEDVFDICNLPNISARFYDSAPNSRFDYDDACSNVSPAKSGDFQPFDDFSILNGESMDGDWILEVRSKSSFLQRGSLQTWSLAVSTGSIVSDDCSGILLTDFHDDTLPGLCIAEQLIERTYFASDHCGNRDSCTQLITIFSSLPALTSLPDTTIDCKSDTSVTSLGTPNVSVGCDLGFELSYVDSSFAGKLAPAYGYAIANRISGADRLLRINLATGEATTVTTISKEGFQSLTGGEFIDGEYYFSIQDSLYKVDTSTGQLSAVLAAQSFVALDQDPTTGTTYGLQIRNDSLTLTRIDLETRSVTLVGQNPEITLPLWLAIDPIGNAYVLDGVTDAIFRIDLNTGKIVNAGLPVTDGTRRLDFRPVGDAEFVTTQDGTFIYGTGNEVQFGNVFGRYDIATGIFDSLGSVPLFTGAFATPDLQVVDRCPIVETILRTWVVEDDCGGRNFSTQWIEVQDTSAPILDSNPEIVVHGCNDLDVDLTDVALVSLPSFSDCGLDSFRLDFLDTLILPCSTVVERYVTAVDHCGNESEILQTIILVDSTTPTIICPPDTTLDCTSGVGVMIAGQASANDNCGVDSLYFIDEVVAGDCPSTDNIYRKWLAIDLCGNADSCIQVITRIDTVGPEMICPPDLLIPCDSILAELVLFDTAASRMPEKIFGGLTALMISDTIAFDELPSGVTLQNIVLEVDIEYADAFAVGGRLITPSGTSITVFRQFAGGACENNDVKARFFETAPQTSRDYSEQCNVTSPAKSGDFQPFESFRKLVGEPISGDWILEVFIERAQTSEQIASLNSWSLSLSSGAIATDACSRVLSNAAQERTISGDCASNDAVLRTYYSTDACGNRDSCTQIVAFYTPLPDVTCQSDTVVDYGTETGPEFLAPVSSTASCGSGVSLTYTDSVLVGQLGSSFGYALTNNGGMDSLIRIDLASGSMKNIAALPRNGFQSLTGGEFIEGNFYSSIGDTLFQIDTATALLTAVLATDRFWAMDTDPISGKLFGLRGVDSLELYEIDLKAQTTTLVGKNSHIANPTWLAIDLVGNAFVMDASTDAIYRIDLSTAKLLAGAVPITDGDQRLDFLWRGDAEFVTTNEGTFLYGTGFTSDARSMFGQFDPRTGVFDSLGQVLNLTGAFASPGPQLVDTYPVLETIIRKWQFEDACGQINFCTQIIGIQDTTAPVFIGGAQIDVSQCIQHVDLTNPSVAPLPWFSESCGLDSIAITYLDTTVVADDCDVLITREVVLTDLGGNEASLVQTVRIRDTVAPQPGNCPSMIPMECGEKNELPINPPTYTDNCSPMADILVTALIDTIGEDTPTATDDTIRIRYFAMDLCGNVDSSCFQYFICRVPCPSISCQSRINVSLGPTRRVTITPRMLLTSKVDPGQEQYCSLVLENPWGGIVRNNTIINPNPNWVYKARLTCKIPGCPQTSCWTDVSIYVPKKEVVTNSKVTELQSTGLSSHGRPYLHQNRPNPFFDETVIGFDLPSSMEATISIYDGIGRLQHAVEGDYIKGYNEIKFRRNKLGQSGVFYYQLRTTGATLLKRMIILE